MRLINRLHRFIFLNSFFPKPLDAEYKSVPFLFLAIRASKYKLYLLKDAMIDFLLKILPGIVTAILASYLATKWSLRKFYSEKWWQRKENAYIEIIDALYDLIQYCETQKEDYGSGTGYSECKIKKFRERYNRAFWEIKKTTDIGAFVVSSQAATILKELRDRPKLEWTENPPWEIYEQDYEYYKDALNKIIQVAKEDLKANKA